MSDQQVQELCSQFRGPWTFWLCPECGWLGFSVDGHCRQFDEHPDGPRIPLLPVDLIRRSEADALAEALESVVNVGDRAAVLTAEPALLTFRSRHPKETP